MSHVNGTYGVSPMGRELRRGDYQLSSSPSMDRAVIVVMGTVAVDV